MTPVHFGPILIFVSVSRFTSLLSVGLLRMSRLNPVTLYLTIWSSVLLRLWHARMARIRRLNGSARLPR